MIRKFKFDYDKENDDLFMYDPKSRSNRSIELDDLIIDYNSKMQISAIELLNASSFFTDLGNAVGKSKLLEIANCKVDIIPKSSFFLLKFILTFKSKEQLTTPLIIPSITEPSPAALV